MPNIRVSNRVMTLIRQYARGVLDTSHSRELANGDWLIPVDNEVAEKIHSTMFPNESLNDCLERLFLTDKGTN